MNANGRMLRSQVGGEGVRLAVRQWGEASSVPVLLLHGYPDTSAVWTPVAERLNRFNVIAYDVRGAGESEAPKRTADYRLEHLMGDLEAVIDATSPHRAVHLVGHDWGSIQGWEAVTSGRFAGRVASYTSISGPPLDHVGRWMRHARPSSAARQGLRSWYVYFFHLPWLPVLVWRAVGARPEVLARLEGVARGEGWPAPTLAADGAHGVRLYRANIGRRLARPRHQHTDVPVQLIVPTADRYVTPALLDGLEQVAPSMCRREVVAGHWVVRTHAAAVAGWISEHVDSVEGGASPTT